MLKTGLVSISFRVHSPKEIIMATKEAGLMAIEWGSDVHAPCDDIHRLNAIARLQNEYGINCSSYGTYFRMGTNRPEEIKPYISAAKILGTNVLRIWCGCQGSERCKKCGKHNLLDEAKELTEIAEEENVILCLEFHPNTFSDCLESSLRVMKNVNSPHLRMYWQPNQFESFDTNRIEAKGLAEYVENIHVFNWLGNERHPLVEAVDKWAEYAKILKGDHYMLLEFMPDNKIESLKTEAEALMQIVKGD